MIRDKMAYHVLTNIITCLECTKPSPPAGGGGEKVLKGKGEVIQLCKDTIRYAFKAHGEMI